MSDNIKIFVEYNPDIFISYNWEKWINNQFKNALISSGEVRNHLGWLRGYDVIIKNPHDNESIDYEDYQDADYDPPFEEYEN